MRDNYRLGPLADSQAPRAAPAAVPVGSALAWLKSLLLIRHVETAVAKLVESGTARCPCHLAIGQEAVPVGLADHLTPADAAFGAHRAHGLYLALGGDPAALLAEILGRASGCSHGLGGSMHLYAPEVGLHGTVPIVAATIPIAVGAGLASKMRGDGTVAVAAFGDGATEEGVFHESLNLARVNDASVLFLCENNLFASHLHISLRQPFDATARFAAANGIPYEVVDGNDVAAVAEATAALLVGVRAGEGPAYLEAVTYRWLGHVGHRDDLDVGVQRRDDVVGWKTRDPVARVRTQALAAGATTEQLDALDAETQVLVEGALAEAMDAPFPADEILYTTVLSPER